MDKDLTYINFQNQIDRFNVVLEEYRLEIKKQPLEVAMYHWLQTLQQATRTKYERYFKELLDLTHVKYEEICIGEWIYINQESVKVSIKGMSLSKSSTYIRIECLNSFNRFIFNLLHMTRESIKNDKPVSVLKASNVPPLEQFFEFMRALSEWPKELSIASLMYYGSLRITTVLNIRVSEIHWEDNYIDIPFRALHKRIPIPDFIIKNIREINGCSHEGEEYVFRTRNGRPHIRNRINFIFKKACEISEIETEINPDTLSNLKRLYDAKGIEQSIVDKFLIKIMGIL